MNSHKNYCNIYTNSIRISRMSWYLIERDLHSDVDYKVFGNHVPYCVVPADGLKDDEEKSLYTERNITYRINGMDEKGKVILATDNKAYVEYHMKLLMENYERAQKHEIGTQLFFLVTYTTQVNIVTLAIIKREQIIRPLTKIVQQSNVCIKDDGQEYEANIVSFDHDECVLREYMFELQMKSRNECPEEKNRKPLSANPWLLVQYSSSPRHAHQRVICFSHTIWTNENPNIEKTVYISDGMAIYVGAIVYRSDNYNALLQKLNLAKQKFSTNKLQLQSLTTDSHSALTYFEYRKFKAAAYCDEILEGRHIEVKHKKDFMNSMRKSMST